tara:strand:- start:49520 stop:49765 length:246 start_codon:yes stop_codon:yes gene_type:complete
MKEKLQPIVYKATALLFILACTFIFCAMLAGPLMIGWNFSFGLFMAKITYTFCLKILLLSVLGLALIGATLNYLAGRDGDG